VGCRWPSRFEVWRRNSEGLQSVVRRQFITRWPAPVEFCDLLFPFTSIVTSLMKPRTRHVPASRKPVCWDA